MKTVAIETVAVGSPEYRVTACRESVDLFLLLADFLHMVQIVFQYVYQGSNMVEQCVANNVQCLHA